ncbi:hypothetical protein ACWCQN_04740 [Streptomyces sp. NPDC001984]
MAAAHLDLTEGTDRFFDPRPQYLPLVRLGRADDSPAYNRPPPARPGPLHARPVRGHLPLALSDGAHFDHGRAARLRTRPPIATSG